MDLHLAAIPPLTFTSKLRFLRSKWQSLASLAMGASGTLEVGAARATVHTVSDLGTLQSNVIDVYDEVITPGILGPRPTLVDVGANIGQWSMAVKWFIPDAHVLAIEPEPTSFTRLATHVSQLDGVDCLQTAVGATTGTATLYRQELSAMATLHPSSYDSREDPVEVRLSSLDELVPISETIDLLKIDVEGAEMDVLEGCANTLSRVRFLQAELSLDRGVTNGIDFLAEVKRLHPRARIIKFGRPLGRKDRPACQDVVLELGT